MNKILFIAVIVFLLLMLSLHVVYRIGSGEFWYDTRSSSMTK